MQRRMQRGPSRCAALRRLLPLRPPPPAPPRPSWPPLDPPPLGVGAGMEMPERGELRHRRLFPLQLPPPPSPPAAAACWATAACFPSGSRRLLPLRPLELYAQERSGEKWEGAKGLVG
ncbi:hypothetical protein E2562_011980 [Oryza meyeriana var. granulata]|uniref:Uncharacterized protein n=1 Tax=Oryza meyeriana var. granulata TaxID=110450 RepID=A0A6G1F757_9ORYZ|nr:hypothetical protein E2562_011980 [Oryza meyeriana var. granulata]